MLNCAAIFKFFYRMLGRGAPETPAPITIANFDFKMGSKNCATFVLNCAAIFKFCVTPLCPQEHCTPCIQGKTTKDAQRICNSLKILNTV